MPGFGEITLSTLVLAFTPRAEFGLRESLLGRLDLSISRVDLDTNSRHD